MGVEALPDGTAVNPTTKRCQGEASALKKLMAAVAAQDAEDPLREQKATRGVNQFYLLSLDQSIEHVDNEQTLSARLWSPSWLGVLGAPWRHSAWSWQLRASRVGGARIPHRVGWLTIQLRAVRKGWGMIV